MRTRWSLVALLTLLGMLTVSGTALAHDTLESSNPAAGSTVTSAPHQIVLTFNEEVDPHGGSVIVHGPDGARRDTGAITVAGAVVTVGLQGKTPNGPYHVEWRVVSADGHPVGGQFGYTLAVVGPAAAGSAAPTSGTVLAADSTTPSSAPGWPWLLPAVAIVLLGAAVGTRVLRTRN
jgi:hypothetical protein